ncbi:DUF5132 domain-containing protein [Methylomagnum sp.]
MAKLKDLLDSDIIKGIGIGVGVAAAGLVLFPALRPAARAAIKSGILLAEKGREWMAVAGEEFDDLVAEVRAELAETEFVDVEDMGEAVEEAAGAEVMEPQG